MTIEGVTPSVQAAMAAVGATVLAEDGMLFRVCEHGIAHPVGSLHGIRFAKPATRDGQVERHTACPSPGVIAIRECCGCCVAWTTAAEIVTEAPKEAGETAPW